MQTNLFQDDPAFIPARVDGLIHIANYIDAADEKNLIHMIDQQPWMHDLKRRVQHYGYRYDYKARTVAPEMFIGLLPQWMNALRVKLFEDKLISQLPDQAIVNEYLPGQGISAHTDCIPCFGQEVISLSLCGTCVMDFHLPKTGQKTSYLLHPRDLIILSGPARYEWQHGIAARKSDTFAGQKLRRVRRISLTFRKVILASAG